MATAVQASGQTHDAGIRFRRHALPLAVIAALVLAAWISLMSASPAPIVVGVGVVALAASAVWPRVAAIFLMILWAGPFATQAASQRIGGVLIDVADGIVLVALIAHMYRCWRDRRPLVRRPASLLFVGPIAVWLIVVTFGITRGIGMGNALGTGGDALMAMSALSAYLVLRIAYANRMRTFTTDVVTVAGVGCALLAVFAVTGIAQQLGVVVDTYFTRGAQDDSLRIDAPVQRLAILAVLLIVLGSVPYRNPTWQRRVLLLAPLVIGLGMSLTRSTWLPLIAAAVVIPAFLARGRQIPVALLRRGVVSIVALLLAIGVGSSGVLGPYVEGVATRFVSAADTDVLQDDSYQQRLVENEKAALRIAEEPVWGIGFPRGYGAFIRYWPEGLNIQVFVERDFIHNSYLGVVMFFGMPGLFSGLVLGLAVLTLARATALAVPKRRAVPLACLGTLAVLAAMSTFQTQLGYEPFYFTLAVVFALADVWRGRSLVEERAHSTDHTRGRPVRPLHSPSGWAAGPVSSGGPPGR